MWPTAKSSKRDDPLKHLTTQEKQYMLFNYAYVDCEVFLHWTTLSCILPRPACITAYKSRVLKEYVLIPAQGFSGIRSRRRQAQTPSMAENLFGIHVSEENMKQGASNHWIFDSLFYAKQYPFLFQRSAPSLLFGFLSLCLSAFSWMIK